ncbi:hypothetical protein MAR_037528, partial [Mya arenaria]
IVYVAEFGNKRLLGYHRSKSNNLNPAWVIRVEMTSDGRVAEIQEVFADDGSRLFGSTGATNVSGKLVICTVTRQAMVCDMQ